MRRFAKQDREDKYASKRDYQQVTQAKAIRLTAREPSQSVSFSTRLECEDPDAAAGAGCFIRVPKDSSARLLITTGQRSLERKFHCGPSWSRIGLSFALEAAGEVKAELLFEKEQAYVDVWGLSLGISNFPKGLDTDKRPTPEQMNVSHLLPETLYLDHEIDIKNFIVEGFDAGEGERIEVKKCSYCGRLLPTGPGQPGRLSFHKHNVKVSGHQNECRACKKWRINDSFNPLRTTDQLNESSIITRERRLLLREPEILQTIKEREGRGLKSIVWERFKRRCFYCNKSLKLAEVELDHTRPLSYLWPIDEFATCLCSEHNNYKKDKFPVDYYTHEQLERLAEITSLSIDELSARSVCQPELRRIREDIVGFAKKSDPRAFNAIARKVRELESDVDLWAELKKADISLHDAVRSAADERPNSSDLTKAEAAETLLNSLEN